LIPQINGMRFSPSPALISGTIVRFKVHEQSRPDGTARPFRISKPQDDNASANLDKTKALWHPIRRQIEAN
jgi:hypothetical protein